ncbi:MAG: NADPH-dependent assimilatory sulfite reductase hemoprotein subunit [Kiritimatiellae bacterium]|jgi:sulfite reductase (NADPH) hemoprotein beta-component|nr:NADPH-dependent assimilatory sulfite reductase hemoprotein subunit [Kiritimatiellia bacterium]
MPEPILDLNKPVPENHEHVEHIKEASNYLRGTIEEGLADPLTGAIADDDTQLTKFHGSYQQDDRELRNERRHSRLEPAYSFMIRVRVPGGICTAEQYLEMDRIANTLANGTIKLTTRQAFQFHGVLKRHLKQTMQEIIESSLDTIAACGDVNRNVMCNPNPYQSKVHEEVYKVSCAISDHLTPQTSAYYEIWMDGEKVISTPKQIQDDEPLYTRRYLPRKFKIAVAIPPYNDVDIFANDIGLIAIEEDGSLKGFNVAVGGGMGMTHGMTETYPRLASTIGFVPTDKIVDTVEKIMTIQRDYGCRTNRKHARFKYTIDDYGLDFIKEELEKRSGYALRETVPYEFERNGDTYGWLKGTNGKWFLTLFIEGGRIKDTKQLKLMSALRLMAQKAGKADFRLTGNQNLMIGNLTDAKKKVMEEIMQTYKIGEFSELSGLRKNSIACVALPTCALAMAESERYLPELITKIEEITEKAGLRDDEIVIRMTGCPNGCGRPYLGEIGFVGKAPGKYNLYLGAGFSGERLNKMYRENIDEETILSELEPILNAYAKERDDGERFGDFTIR